MSEPGVANNRSGTNTSAVALTRTVDTARQVSPRRHTNRSLLAPLTLLAVGALVAITLADGASRSGQAWGTGVFWIAMFTCAGAFAYRLAGSSAGRTERIGLVVAFGLFLYFVKVLRDPTAFTYSDELAHVYNVNQIVSTHRIFIYNPINPLTPRYPGLEAATAALRLLGGTSTFVAGLIVIAIARLLMMLALFLLLELVSSSSRVAGLGALLYTANANFVFFDGQFSYESLSLPLAVLGAYAALRWVAIKDADIAATGSAPRTRLRRGWAVAAIVIILAVVVTHHVTAYVLAAFLFAIARIQRETQRFWKSYATPYAFGAFTAIAALIWIVFIASGTWNYLSSVISIAVKSALDTFRGQLSPRQLFSAAGPSAGDVTPVGYRILALAAAGLAAVGIPFGLWRIWRDHRSNAGYLVLGAVGAAYVVSLALRFVPAAWEVANRASEFLFVGVGLALATIGLERWRPRSMPRLGMLAVAAAFSVLLGGGMVAGWSADLLLAQAYDVKAGRTSIVPQGAAAADWARDLLGPHKRFAADASNAHLLGGDANEFTIWGTKPDVYAVIHDPRVEGWHLRLLKQLGIRYVVVDRRRVSEDPLAGYFFSTSRSPAWWRLTFGKSSVQKFDRVPTVSRVFDSGNIVIYDVGRLVSRGA